MPSEVAIVTLRPAVHRGTLQDGNVTRFPESHFVEFVIDGWSLLQALGQAGHLVTPLNRPWLESVPGSVDQLLGRRTASDLAPGRIALLLCGVCGDLGCGAVTASLHVDPDRVTWEDFRWENGYDEPSAVSGAPDTITFGRANFDAEIGGSYVRVAELPPIDPADRPRTFLWPWQWGWRLPPRQTVRSSRVRGRRG